MKRRKRNEKLLFTPLQTTEALLAIGEKYDRKKALLYYSAVLFISLILGLLFEVSILYR